VTTSAPDEVVEKSQFHQQYCFWAIVGVIACLRQLTLGYSVTDKRGAPISNLEQLRVLFDRLLAELPQGAAKLNVSVPKGTGTVIEMIPSNDESASFGVHVEDGLDLVDFSFGRIATWELPYEGRNRRPSAGQLLLEVEQMSRAVIAGKCEETRKLFYVTSRIYVDGHTYTMVDMPMLPIPPFGTRKYAPFLCGPN
jgi:hypothetical protein